VVLVVDLQSQAGQVDQAEVVDTAVVVVQLHSLDRHSPWELPVLIPTMVIPGELDVTLKHYLVVVEVLEVLVLPETRHRLHQADRGYRTIL
jgi:hypothetical protein